MDGQGEFKWPGKQTKNMKLSNKKWLLNKKKKRNKLG